MIINNEEQLEDLKEKMYLSAEKAQERILHAAEQSSSDNLIPASMALLFSMKFEKTGVDPLNGTDLNIVEQINQLFSNLVVMEAASDLLKLFPGKSFQLHLGTESGFDIESVNDESDDTPRIVCECFAVTTAASNGKLKKDAEKLMSKAPDKKKYMYFYSHNDKEETLMRLYQKYPDITFKRIHTLLPKF